MVGSAAPVASSENTTPLVAVIMGSKSDWETMRARGEMLDALRRAARVPDRLGAPHAGLARRVRRGGAERAASRSSSPAPAARRTCRAWSRPRRVLPVLGVPVQSRRRSNGLDSLLSIVQMPEGVPVGTLAIGKAGAANAGLLAVAILATSRPELREKLRQFRDEQTASVMANSYPPMEPTKLPPNIV